MKNMIQETLLTVGKTVFFAAAMAFAATAADAAQMAHLEVADMAVEAEKIAVGRCLDGASEWVDGQLVTLYTIEVEESLKGAEAETLTVVVPGGLDALRPVPIAVSFPGAPMIRADEDVLLFLDESPVVEGGYQVVGFSQGKYSVVDDGSGAQTVTKSQSGHGHGGFGHDLEEIKDEIRQALNTEGATR